MKKREVGFSAILLLIVILAVAPAIRADPLQAAAVWIEPATLNFDTGATHVGDRFDVTLWASSPVDVFDYQINITYDPAMLNVSSVDYTSASGSEWFAGHGSVAVTPLVDYLTGSVVVGETLFDSDVVGASNGSICSITFVIIAAPKEGSAFVSFIDTNHQATSLSSYILDPNMSELAGVKFGRVTYTFSAGGLPPPMREQAVVSDLRVSSNQVEEGDLLWIIVETINNGTVAETFDVNATYDGALIGKQTVDSLSAGATQTLTFSWDTAGVASGNHTISVTATPLDGQTDFNSISKITTVEVTARPPPPNTKLFTTPSTVQSTSIGQNFTVEINIADVVDLFAWQTRVNFDLNILRCTGFYEGQFLKASNRTYLFLPYNSDFQKAGSNITGSTLMGSGSGLNGSGQLAYATFTSVGIGVSDVRLVDPFLLSSSLAKIPFETLASFTVPSNGTSFQVEIADNMTGANFVSNVTEATNATSLPVSGVLNITFNASDKKITFQAVATETWYCQISVPKELLNCSALSGWTVNVDGTPVSYNATENNGCTELYFTSYMGSHHVEIIGTNAIRESTQTPPANPPSGGNPQNPGNGKSQAPPELLVIAAASVSLLILIVALVDLRRTRRFEVREDPTET